MSRHEPTAVERAVLALTRGARRRPWLSATGGVMFLCAVLITWIDMPLAHALRAHLPHETFGFFKVLTDIGLTGLWYVLAADLPGNNLMGPEPSAVLVISRIVRSG